MSIIEDKQGLSEEILDQADAIARELLPGLIAHAEHYNAVMSTVDVLINSAHTMRF